MSDWCTIESDPGVFTELIEKIGVKGISVDEVYSLEDEGLMKSLGKIHGFIFLFKWQKETTKRDCLPTFDNDLFFAHQVITNACATQAILSVLMNIEGLEMGAELENFKSFSMALDPKTRGQIIGDCQIIKTVHNSFAKPEPFVFEGKRQAKESDDVFHFISYIPFKNKIYELDGLQPGPILHGDAGDDWIVGAKAAINERIHKYAADEIRFTLLAITESQSVRANQSISDLKKKKGKLYKQLQETQGDEFKPADFPDLQECIDSLAEMESTEEPGMELEATSIPIELEEISNQIAVQNTVLEEEKLKREKYSKENVRRKHNYIPLILELLKIAAEKGELQGLYDQAKDKMKPEKEETATPTA